MAGSQQTLKLKPANADELERHLVACGFANVAAGLARLVRARGTNRRNALGDEIWSLTISSREAATLVGCGDRAIGKAATRLAGEEWFRIRENGRNAPPTYELDFAAAAATPTREQQLDELWAVAPPASGPAENPPPADCAPLRTTAHHCAPLRTTAHHCAPLRTFARVHSEQEIQNPCLVSRVRETGDAAECAPVRSGAQLAARRPASHQVGAEPGRALNPLPWARETGVKDLELVTRCRAGDVRFLRHLYEHAVRMRWIEPSDDAWLKFLTAVHHAASAENVHRRMGLLSTIVRKGLDVSRTRQRSDEWAARVAASEHRDPALAALGRAMESFEEYKTLTPR